MNCNEHASGNIYNLGTVAGIGKRGQQKESLRGKIYGYA